MDQAREATGSSRRYFRQVGARIKRARCNTEQHDAEQADAREGSLLQGR